MELEVGKDTGSGLSLPPQRKLSDIFSSAREYDNQGRLYRGIEDGLEYLSQKYGQDRLFLGPPEAQIADAYFSLPGLNPVTDLASAAAALKVIVEQGEGARESSEKSLSQKSPPLDLHYARQSGFRRTPE